MSHKVNVVSVCTSPSYDPETDVNYFLNELENAAATRPDIILTPECWLGFPGKILDTAHSLPEFRRVCQIARQYRTYIACTCKREAFPEEKNAILARHPGSLLNNVTRFCFNSILLIDRNGNVVYTYDKLYPWPVEFQDYSPNTDTFDQSVKAPFQTEPSWPGSHTGVYDCDFGRVGFAICFDLNFPEVWRQLAMKRAELVLWSAAFDGGISLRCQAGINNYYIVTSTCIGTGGCHVEDITGEELLYCLPAPGALTQTVSVELDLDRTLFHKNYNEGQIALAEKKYPGIFHRDDRFESTAEWIILDTDRDGYSVKELCREFSLLPYREFKTTSVAAYIDHLRGVKFPFCH
jgi:predicted amidohydrolase